jgi:hypothetical protein
MWGGLEFWSAAWRGFGTNRRNSMYWGEFVLVQMAAAALARVQEFINRSAGQHLRAMREQWSQT